MIKKVMKKDAENRELREGADDLSGPESDCS